MRLTLRTMLAYLDNVLDPADAETLGAKVKESDFASGLVQRIRTISRKVRMAAPKVDAKGLAQDANSVAEYLDSALPQDRIGDFERICLESDVHLAEVAASHQILTMVLGHPAEVPTAIRERIYGIAHNPPIPSPGASDSSPSPPPVQVPVGSNGRSADAVHPAATVPDYLRTGGSRVWPFVATVAAAMVLATLGLRAMGPFDSAHPVLTLFGGGKTVADASQAQTTVPTETPKTDNDANQDASPAAVTPPTVADKTEVGKAKPSVPSEPVTDVPPPEVASTTDKPAPQPAPTPMPETLATTTPATPIPPTTAPPATPPSTTPPETVTLPATVVPAATPPAAPMDVGRFVSEQQLLARWDAKNNVWFRMEPRSVLLTGERLVVLPTYRPIIALPSGAQVTFVGESALQMERPSQEGVSRMEVDYGRMVVVTSGAAGAQIELELAGLQGVATLGDSDSAIAVDVRQWLPPGADPEADALLPVVELFAIRGKITWHEAGQEPTNIPANHARIYMGKGSPETRGPFRAPDWIDARSFVGVDRDASIAIEGVAIDFDRPLNVSLEELVQHRQVEVQALAARCLGALGQFESLLKLLANDKHYSYWAPEIDSLRMAVARGPLISARMRESLTRIRPADAERLYRLLWTPSDEQLNGGEAARLVKNLEDSEMDIRVLTFDALRRITGASLFYRPEKRPDLNKVPIQKWKERLSESTIVYKVPPTPLTEFRPLERPAAAPPVTGDFTPLDN